MNNNVDSTMPRKPRDKLKDVTLVDVLKRFTNDHHTLGRLERDLAHNLFNLTKDDTNSRITAYQLWEYATALSRKVGESYLVIAKNSIGAKDTKNSGIVETTY